MKVTATNSLSPDGLLAAAFNPERTLKGQFKGFFSGVWYYSVAMAFFLGLPVLTVWVLDVVPPLLGR
jgi:hypothetical protein